MGKDKGGRPSLYTDDLGAQICELIATSSMSMKSIAEKVNVPIMTILCWLCPTHNNYKEEFAKMYTLSKDMQMDYLAEEIIDIADDGSNDYMKIVKGDMEYNVEDKEWTNRSRLRVDARKWIASKLKPKRYGDKLDLNHEGNINVTQITGMVVK